MNKQFRQLVGSAEAKEKARLTRLDYAENRNYIKAGSTSMEENETTINICHETNTFDVYTTNKRTSKNMIDRLPEYYKISEDRVSAELVGVPMADFRKLKI